jgi:hypothetical protein
MQHVLRHASNKANGGPNHGDADVNSSGNAVAGKGCVRPASLARHISTKPCGRYELDAATSDEN